MACSRGGQRAALPTPRIASHSASIAAVTLSDRPRRWLCVWLILATLFTQLATAAYACPAQSRGADDAMPCAMAMAMSDGLAGALDPEQPNLCQQHCLPDSQTPDGAQPLSVPAAVAIATLTVALAPLQHDNPSAWNAWRDLRERVRPPPHSLLHCCFRI